MGTKLGALKSKLGLKGLTKPGQMISRMNKMKSDTLKEKGEKKEPKGSERKEVKVVKKTIKKII